MKKNYILKFRTREISLGRLTTHNFFVYQRQSVLQVSQNEVKKTFFINKISKKVIFYKK